MRRSLYARPEQQLSPALYVTTEGHVQPGVFDVTDVNGVKSTATNSILSASLYNLAHFQEMCVLGCLWGIPTTIFFADLTGKNLTICPERLQLQRSVPMHAFLWVFDSRNGSGDVIWRRTQPHASFQAGILEQAR